MSIGLKRVDEHRQRLNELLAGLEDREAMQATIAVNTRGRATLL